MRKWTKPSLKKPTSLVGGVLHSIAKLAVIFAGLASLGAYLNFSRKSKEQLICDAKKAVKNQITVNNKIFKTVTDNIEIFTEEYLHIYHSDYRPNDKDFEVYFFRDSEGAVRMKPEYFSGKYMGDGCYVHGISCMVGNNQVLTDDLQRRLMIAFKVLVKLGPAWGKSLAATAVSFPENAIIMFCPHEPWGLKAQADLRMNELGVIRSMVQAENPERQPNWTGLYFDETVGEWAVTYQKPVDSMGQHLINPSHDLYLNALLKSLIDESSSDTYCFVLKKEGFLIAHPDGFDEDQKHIGQLSLERANNPMVTRAYHLIEEQLGLDFQDIGVIEDSQDDCFLIVGKIQGPDWIYIKVLPKELVRKNASKTAMWVGIGAGTALFTTMSIVSAVLRNQVAKPLGLMRKATEAVSQGDYDQVAENIVKLPTYLSNEIGVLAKRFVDMSIRIRDSRRNLEGIVNDRTADLAKANKRLTHMSSIDGLTEVYNRRIFNLDMEKVFLQARRSEQIFSILLLDIDYFKLYNDKYGHIKGDEVLKEVANTLKLSVRQQDRVYRYGGEEFVIIMPGVDITIAKHVGQRILSNVRKLRIRHSQSQYGHLTISAGVQQYQKSFKYSSQMINAADKKLYHAKRMGRDKLCD